MSDENQVIAADEALPNHIYVVPLQGKPIFPGIFTPIMITGAEDIAGVDKAMDTNKVIGLVLTTDPSANSPNPEDLHHTGTAAKIVKHIKLPDGGVNIFINTLKRFRILKIRNEQSPYSAAVEYLDDDYDPEDKELKGLTRALLTEMKQISEDNPLFSEEMRLNMVNIDNPGKIADFITSILNVDREKQQEILETLDVRKRMEMVLIYINWPRSRSGSPAKSTRRSRKVSATIFSGKNSKPSRKNSANPPTPGPVSTRNSNRPSKHLNLKEKSTNRYSGSSTNSR